MEFCIILQAPAKLWHLQDVRRPYQRLSNFIQFCLRWSLVFMIRECLGIAQAQLVSITFVQCCKAFEEFNYSVQQKFKFHNDHISQNQVCANYLIIYIKRGVCVCVAVVARILRQICLAKRAKKKAQKVPKLQFFKILTILCQLRRLCIFYLIYMLSTVLMLIWLGKHI